MDLGIDAVDDLTAAYDDEGLVQRLSAGDDAALAPLVERHWGEAWRVARPLAGDAAAEDAAQEAFLQLVRAAPRFEAGRAFRPWFLGIVGNVASKQGRSRARRAAREAAAPPADVATHDAAEEAATREAAALVREHLGRLDPSLRHVLALRYLEGMSLADVAAALDLPEGTVSSRVRRGLEALRRSLAPSLPVAALGEASLAGLLARALAAAAPAAPSAAALLALLRGPRAPLVRPVSGPVVAASAALLLAVTAGVVGLGALLLPDPEPGPALVDPRGVDGAGGGRDVAGGRGGDAGDRAAGTTGTRDTTGSAPGPATDGLAPGAPTAVVRLVADGLAPGAPLEGGWVRLVAGEGARIPRALADFGRPGWGWAVPDGAVAADSDGRALVPAPEGRSILLAGARGARTALLALEAPWGHDGERVVRLAWSAPARVALTMTDEHGQPLGGLPARVSVRATPPVPLFDLGPGELPRLLAERVSSSWLELEATTDEAGRLALDLPAGEYRLGPDPDRPSGFYGAVVTEAEGQRLELEGATLTLAPGAERAVTLGRTGQPGTGWLRVRVLDAAGSPARGASCDAVEGTRQVDLVDELPLADARDRPRTNADGVCVLRRCPLGRLRAVARLGDLGGVSDAVVVARPDEGGEVVVRLAQLPVGTLRVRLRDAATGATVTGRFEYRVPYGERRAEFPATLADWPVDQRRFTVWGGGRRGEAVVEVAPGAVVDAVVDLAPDPRALQVHVLGPGGAPIERASVEVLGQSSEGDGRTGADGTCLIGGVVSPDRGVELRVAGPGLLPVRAEVPRGERTLTVTLGEGPRLAFRLLDPEGLPVADASVHLQLDADRAMGPSVAATTGPDGVAAWRGRLGRPAHARFHLRLRSSELFVDDLEVAPSDQDVEHVVRARRSPVPVRITGRVLDAAGQPAAGALVRLSYAHPRGGRRSSNAPADAAGAFSDEVFAGAVRLTARRPDHAEVWLDVDVPPGGLDGVTLQLAAGARVRGRITNGGASAWVAAHPADRRLESVEAEAAADGSYELRHLAPGRWTVQVNTRDGDEHAGVASAVVELSDGEERPLDLEVERRR